ncbi:alpha-tocopherol transfer protein-like [Nilaparvata lugens]|uniref:alpha-tocopherol transfer protein-like n=1 Tax=Nilaparvata lugens TaxID=108931 RepID=UPI00193D006D|nr:alpha-tocopherol transfer protein-like [Nilaparvata lugens]XP_039291893.1 alpha-tocopherol transfer protein-like [Nilaparvata lugens]
MRLMAPPDNVISLEEELKKTDRLKLEDIEDLRRRVNEIPSYPKNVPDVLFSWFLNCSNFERDLAMKYMDINLKLREQAPELFENRDPLSAPLQTVWDLTEYYILPGLTADGYKVFYAGVHDCEPTLYDFCDACKMFLMVGETELVQHGLCKGIVVVMDCKGASFRHLLKVKLRTVKSFLSYVQEGIPINIAQIHVINVSPIVDKMNYIAKPFINKDLMDKVKFHSGEMKEFYETVPRELLPNEIGGTAGPRLNFRIASKENLAKYREWFDFEKTLRLNYGKVNKNGRKVEEIDESLQDLCID